MLSTMLSFVLFGVGLSVLWLIGLTFFFLKLRSHYNTLTQGADKRTLQNILDTLLKEVSDTKKDVSYLDSRCAKIEKDQLLHIQKIGLLRFNPFKDTGGDQSFVLALVDANDTGILISGLYSRSGMRWYAKKVVSGSGIDHDLSEEEKKALKVAKAGI